MVVIGGVCWRVNSSDGDGDWRVKVEGWRTAGGWQLLSCCAGVMVV